KGLYEGGRRRGDEANPWGRDIGGGWRRGDPRYSGHDECWSVLFGPAMGGADPPHRVGTDPDYSRRPEARRSNIVRRRGRGGAAGPRLFFVPSPATLPRGHMRSASEPR